MVVGASTSEAGWSFVPIGRRGHRTWPQRQRDDRSRSETGTAGGEQREVESVREGRMEGVVESEPVVCGSGG